MSVLIIRNVLIYRLSIFVPSIFLLFLLVRCAQKSFYMPSGNYLKIEKLWKSVSDQIVELLKSNLARQTPCSRVNIRIMTFIDNNISSWDKSKESPFFNTCFYMSLYLFMVQYLQSFSVHLITWVKCF